jgi:stage II sporulation protein E
VHLSTGETDLIKIGAPFGGVKCRAGSERVEGASLPMGMLDEMTPAARRYVLSAGDMVVMCTDGVTDTLGDNLLPLVASCAATHPQELASYILDEAVRCDRFAPHDDMTVVAVRVV